MRSIGETVALLAVGLMLVPAFAAADDDIDRKFEAMQKRMDEMEQRLEQTNEELESANEKVEEQEEKLAKVESDDGRRASSGLRNFLNEIDVSGWAAVSYNYNFQGTGNDVIEAGGQNVTTPHHPNPNTFQLDQAWIALDKQPTKESRAGFHIDLAAGVATDSAGWTFDFTDDNGDTGSIPSSPYTLGIFSAYVSYLAPILSEGTLIQGGQIPTAQGVEVVATNGQYNYNVTRGLIWARQPTTSLGFTVSTELAGFNVMAGMINEPISNDEPGGYDTNRAKALTSRVTFAPGEEGKYSIGAGVNWGPSSSVATSGTGSTQTPLNNESNGLLDVLMTAEPIEGLSAWINYDYRWFEDRYTGDTTGTGSGHGIGAAARLEVVEDRTGIAMRFEYVHESQTLPGVAETTLDLYSLTGTIDQQLAPGLTAKLEVRWDRNGNNMLPDRDGNLTETNMVIGLVQLLYEF